MRAKPSQSVVILPRIRVLVNDHIAVGPGKAELLRLIDETSSISEAARQMKMSYMRAWSLIQTMNDCFPEPIILAKRGGRTGGGAGLSRTGQRLLRLYQRLETEFLATSKATRREMTALLKRPRARHPKTATRDWPASEGSQSAGCAKAAYESRR